MTIVIDDGHAVAGCEYEPFGSIISAIIEPTKISHFRHGSYIHDRETGLYYVSSRYYDPEIGRWINADTTDVLSLPYYHPGQYSLFSYCNNM